METENTVVSKPSSRPSKIPRLPDTEIYVYLLVLIYLIDTKVKQNAHVFTV